MADVFISYARGDRERITQLSSALEQAGYSTWWDHRLAGGARFAAEIERALGECRSVIVAWSANSILSEWVMDEADVAKKAGKMIPISLDGTAPPIGFRQYQVVDFSRWRGSAASAVFGELTAGIERFLHGGSHSGAQVLSPPQVRNTLAVLPLENLSGDPAQQYFVDGMHAVLIASLSRISALSVLSRTSTRAYAGSNKSLREIGAELGASKLIEGSVIRDGDQVRINVQLIDAATDTHDWSEDYEGELSNILQLQRDASRAIADQISVVLTPAERDRMALAPRVSPTAYDAYLKGTFYWQQLTPASLRQGIAEFERSLAADADFAPAHAGIAACWAGLQQMGVVPVAESHPNIKAAADRALALDDSLAEVHFVTAVYNTWSTFDWDAAMSSFKRALELDSSFPDAFAYYAHYLCIIDRKDEATAPIERAVNLDPYNPLMRGLYAAVLNFQNKPEQALVEIKRVLQTEPENWLGYEVLRLIEHALGHEQEAVAATATMYSLLGIESVAEALHNGFADGDYRRAMVAGGDALAEFSTEHGFAPVQVALLFDMGGATERAAEYIRKGWEVTDPALPYLRHSGLYSRELLRTAPVQEVLEKMQFPGGPVK